MTIPAPLKRIKVLGSHVLHPGTWMISVRGQSSDEHHPVLTILICQKRFGTSVYRENFSLRSKRTIEGSYGMAKRQRLNDGKGKIAVDSSDLIDKNNENSFLHNYMARKTYNKNISPIPDLADGEVAVVEVSTAGSADTEDEYQLQRIKNAVKLPATSVFTCQHSKTAGEVAAKVPR